MNTVSQLLIAILLAVLPINSATLQATWENRSVSALETVDSNKIEIKKMSWDTLDKFYGQLSVLIIEGDDKVSKLRRKARQNNNQTPVESLNEKEIRKINTVILDLELVRLQIATEMNRRAREKLESLVGFELTPRKPNSLPGN